MRVKNITDSPLSSDFLPGGELAAGETAEVPDTQPDGSELVWPPEYFEVIADDSRTVEELKADLKARGLPTSGTKDELLARLAEAPTVESEE